MPATTEPATNTYYAVVRTGTGSLGKPTVHIETTD
jgi:hypothetical protein